MRNSFNMSERDIERFWSKVEILSNDECWPWTGSFSTKNGKETYGVIEIAGYCERAHRVAFWIKNGKFDDDKKVCHSCDNTRCCNSMHLWLGTYAANNEDRNKKYRQAKGEDFSSSKLTEELVLAIARDTRSQRVIAAEYGISKSLVGNIRRGENWRHMRLDIDADAVSSQNRSSATKLLNRNRSKLSPSDVHSIISDNRTLKELSVIFGISKSSISNIKTGKTWS